MLPLATCGRGGRGVRGSDDHHHMRQALRLAARAAGRVHPNPMVGCVIVQQGEVVGQGWHHRAGAAHAEVEALRHAGDRARGATVYVTLEPCVHYGRTPPCAPALLAAAVARVVVAMIDPNPMVAGQGVAALRAAGVEVTLGCCQQEAEQLNAAFVSWVTRGRPLVTLKAALSLDGKMATESGESRWITGSAARQWAHRLRDRHDLVMTGIGTVLSDDPRLNCRLSAGRDPIRLVVDSQLRLPDHAAILSSSTTAPLWLASTEQADRDRWSLLQQQMTVNGSRLISCRATAAGRVDLADLLVQLAAAGITSVLCETGSCLSGALLAQQLVDRVALFLAPRLVGGHAAIGLLASGVARLVQTPWIQDMEMRPLGDDVLVMGSVCYPAEGEPCLPA
ncbi:MAG: bifunctional diaminohydroxyphosphoribosylaminopyrimidine deaminase/5-amino-6-(5-phosphoribosylamino)uracil reductase RibD [Magnetococcales bacterium]|nr:bifunctional diaminohydroxyphosphoribosylaminopyrimidine deaminase/5-amino-6-(5-phosphoribosylamino)uracil reductase RibD [Magnetococcales bacterium]